MTSPDQFCPLNLCDGSGFIVDEKTNTVRDCRCRSGRLARVRNRALAGVIPRKYRGVSFDRPPVTQLRSGVVTAVRDYVDNIEQRLDAGRGLWLFGPVGTGKTTLAMLTSKAAAQAGFTIAIYSLPRLLAQIRATFDDNATLSRIDFLNKLATVDLLHIDDVGAEQTSPWVLEQLYVIVNERYETERSVLITTNLEREALAEQITERTVSRLEEMCEILPVVGSDARRITYQPDPHSMPAREEELGVSGFDSTYQERQN